MLPPAVVSAIRGYRAESPVQPARPIRAPVKAVWPGPHRGPPCQIDQDGGAFFRSTQEVVLQGVDLTAAGTMSDQDIIADLMANNNLITD